MLTITNKTTFTRLLCICMFAATIGCDGNSPTSNNTELFNNSPNSLISPNINNMVKTEIITSDNENISINNDPIRDYISEGQIIKYFDNSEPKIKDIIHPDSITVFKNIITFEDILDELPDYDMKKQHALITFKDINWDNDGIPGGTGWGVYNTTNSQARSGNNYVMNRHGKNFLGFTFPRVVKFIGAYFAMATNSNMMDPYDPSGYSAVKLKYHFYDNDLNFMYSSDWFDLNETSEFFAANVEVRRVVIEHDILNTTSAQFGITDAEWFSMDDLILK